MSFKGYLYNGSGARLVPSRSHFPGKSLDWTTTPRPADSGFWGLAFRGVVVRGLGVKGLGCLGFRI